MTVNRGTIVRYGDRGYGYIMPDGKSNISDRIFFHISSGRILYIYRDRVSFGSVRPDRGFAEKDRVVYEIGRNDKGPIAHPVAFEDEYNAKVRQVETEKARKNATVEYRVVRHYDSAFEGTEVPADEIVWQGTDLNELGKKFPKKYYSNGNTMDQLRPVKDSRPGVMIVSNFERKIDDRWERFGDPRLTERVIVPDHKPRTWRGKIGTLGTHNRY